MTLDRQIGSFDIVVSHNELIPKFEKKVQHVNIYLKYSNDLLKFNPWSFIIPHTKLRRSSIKPPSSLILIIFFITLTHVLTLKPTQRVIISHRYLFFFGSCINHIFFSSLTVNIKQSLKHPSLIISYTTYVSCVHTTKTVT